MFVSCLPSTPKVHVEIPTPDVMVYVCVWRGAGGGYGRELGPENAALRNGMSECPYKRDPQSSLAPPAMEGHSEKTAIHEP